MNALSGREVECIRESKNNDCYEYIFQLKNKKWERILPKEKQFYNKLNFSKESEGIEFKAALKKGIFLLKDSNKIYFRRKSIIMLENTFFHLISNNQILMNRISRISHEFFKDVIEKDASNESKIMMLKNILQIMGWGAMTVSMEKNNEISININHLPYGLQRENDNWDFLINVILGYMWLLDKKFKIKKVGMINSILKIDFSTN